MPRFSILSVTLLVTLLMAGCSKVEKDQLSPPPVISGLVTSQVRLEELQEQLELVGTVRAATSAMVSARIPGTISLLHVREGDHVQKGKLLAQLESSENLAQAGASRAAIEEAKGGVDEAEARYRLAESTFARFRQLYEEQALTEHEFDTRKTELELARQGLARARARLEQSREAARAAGAVADYTRVLAPVSGLIVSRQVDLGSSVFPGQHLMTIDDSSSYKLELSVPETLADQIRVGTVADLQIDATGGRFDGRVTDVVPASDPASRTYIAKVPISSKGVRSGMFGRALVRSGPPVKKILLPAAAVFERGSLSAVWCVEQEGVIRMRIVKPGKRYGDRVEILSGLSAGDRVVTAGVEKGVDGGRIAEQTTGAENRQGT